MAQPDQAVSIRVNSEEDPSDKVDDPGRETTKTDMKVVISITPDSEKEGEDQAQSLTESESLESGDSLGSQETGLVNKAYVEDETEQSNVKVGKRRGHQRSPSYSPNKDDESITAVGGGGSEELDKMVNPPILSDVTESDKEKQQYSEYFMPVNEYKPQLGEYKKTKKGASAAKIFCWTFSLFLLAGAIVLAVLIGTGIIDTDPTRTVKVSRKLQPETGARDNPGTVNLIEVKEMDLPNVRTNLPEFFTSKPTHFTGELRLDSLDWSPELADRNSYQFQQLANILEDGISEVLRNQFESFTFDTAVRTFAEGSVIVLFDIDVTSKLETDDFLDKTDIANALKNNINQEYGFLFGKFSAPNNSVIIQGSQAEDIDDQQTEKNMQSVGTMRTTTREATTQSRRLSSGIQDNQPTARPQISDDWENMRNMEISAKSNIDSVKDNGDMEMDTDSESTSQQELSETVTEHIEPVTDISYEFKSLELESELGSGEVEDATDRVQTLILY